MSNLRWVRAEASRFELFSPHEERSDLRAGSRRRLCRPAAAPPRGFATQSELRRGRVCRQAYRGGGITRYLYGGNAFLYHITLEEYEALLDWLAGFGATRWPVPSVGPSFGRAMDQARLLKRRAFRAAMVLPCNDPRDALGMEAGLREIADTAGLPLILYLKSEDGFGSNKEAGLDAVGRLIDDGVASRSNMPSCSTIPFTIHI